MRMTKLRPIILNTSLHEHIMQQQRKPEPPAHEIASSVNSSEKPEKTFIQIRNLHQDKKIP